jgi:hypothetical protein
MLPGMRPLPPAQPIALQHSPTQLLVAWALPRSHGAPIAGFAVQTMRTLQSKHPDESDSEPEPPPDPTPFNGPLGVVLKPPPTKWKSARIPEYVTKGSRIQEPLSLEEIAGGGRPMDVAGGDQITLIQQKKLIKLLPCDRRWAYTVVGGFKPCSRHSFRVQVRLPCRRLKGFYRALSRMVCACVFLLILCAVSKCVWQKQIQ